MLTREEIAALPAGTELNILVAEMLFGCQWQGVLMQKSVEQLTGYISGQRGVWAYRKMRAGKPAKNTPIDLPGSPKPHLPDFSGDIAAAWQVVEALLAKGWHYTVASSHVAGTLAQLKGAEVGKLYQARAETAPLAICRAALLALLAPAPPTLSGNNPKS